MHHRLIRAAACCALVSSLAACVVAPPPAPRPAPAPRPSPQVVGYERMQQIQGRIDNLSRRIDARVNAGYYPPPTGAALHRRLDVIRQESSDMAAQHGGGLSGDEQRVLNQELDTAARAIGE
ncbi:hypothetical protein WS67_12985 [Burkholderia singularis]|uniref:Lipoprotein n=1 Tax=Burkholderia singularis TaxID=1503053 RepID=A0A118DNU0_9BURK|nr:MULTISPECIES: hypothetical protein [Burkholderia]AOK30793.1 hypothetical protein AQ611_01980 [Burkholderia sp. Bp7605]KVE27024.1 hypothetical protein WS67_12985 [Burkholderia singularis]SMG02551.1 FIG00454724: hypothetical protein [Burkholderia singularis]